MACSLISQSDDQTFTREFHLEHVNTIITLYQCSVGDVGCVVWDAALVLAKYLDFSSRKKSWLKNKDVLELGAGAGCVGITAACLGANVTVTDLAEILPLLQKNVEANRKQIEEGGGKINAQILKWGDTVNTKLFNKQDIILLADVVYYEESVEPLVQTLLSLSNDDTIIILSHEKRGSDKQNSIWKAFINEIDKHFDFRIIPRNEQDPEYYSADILLMQGRKKKSQS